MGTRCRVSYLDSRNVEHAVDITADSLFEAAAAAVKAFRQGALVEELPVAGTELRITVLPLPVEHRVRLQRVEHGPLADTSYNSRAILRRRYEPLALKVSTSPEEESCESHCPPKCCSQSLGLSLAELLLLVTKIHR